MNCEEIITKLKSLGNPKNVEGMARFGISANNTLGISIPILRKLAKEINTIYTLQEYSLQGRHRLTLQLWNSGIHEARILASMIDDPKEVTEKQMDKWASEFDSWDVCDQVCMNLFGNTNFAWEKPFEWAKDEREFVRRAAFALIAVLAVHDKTTSNSEFEKFFPLIKKYSIDDRNFVKKAVNWALRQIGKKNANLKKSAIKTAREVEKLDNKAAKWIAKDAIRELTDN
jgi:3-methyladenine DNA glycosylase AlkD